VKNSVKNSLPAAILHDQAGAIAIKIHPRSTRLTLSFKKTKRQFSLTAPAGTSKRRICQFIAQSEPWILEQLSTVVVFQKPVLDHLLFQGETYQIVQESLSRRALYKIDQVQKIITIDPVTTDLSHSDESPLVHRLRYLCIKEFKKIFPSIVNRYTKTMGLHPAKISIKDPKSCWGSCSTTGNISISWRLIMAPIDVMTYVLIHELAHLKHMNHSADFWQLVTCHSPLYKDHRRWLKVHALELHHL
jgi:predicted metal-dependent hydrolase